MKKKILLIGLVIIIVLVMILESVVIIFIKQRDNRISLIQDRKVIEYGEMYNPTLEQLVDLEKFDYINTEKVKIESDIKHEENKEYLAVGTYQINVYYKDKVLTQIVECKDSVAPELTIPETIELENAIDLNTVDFKNYIKYYDLSEIKDYNIDFSNIDTNKSGEYIAKVSIGDIYGNTTDKELKILIQEKVVHETDIQQESNTQEKHTTANKKSTSSGRTPTTSEKSNIKTISTSNQQASNNLKNSNSSGNNLSDETTKKEEPIWCDEGGTKHWQGTGANEHGYYKTWDEAWEACKAFMKGFKSGNYAVRECPCGLYYFWVVED